jgi:hypothetical protein
MEHGQGVKPDWPSPPGFGPICPDLGASRIYPRGGQRPGRSSHSRIVDREAYGMHFRNVPSSTPLPPRRFFAQKSISIVRVDGTRAFVATNAVAALGCFPAAIAHPALSGYGEFLCYFSVVLPTSTLKVTLPRIDGTLSVSFIFLFLAMLEMTYAETLVLGVASVFVQSSKRLKPIQVIFNLSRLTLATQQRPERHGHAGSDSVRSRDGGGGACRARSGVATPPGAAGERCGISEATMV